MPKTNIEEAMKRILKSCMQIKRTRHKAALLIAKLVVKVYSPERFSSQNNLMQSCTSDWLGSAGMPAAIQ